jgi:hypothetical protein
MHNLLAVSLYVFQMYLKTQKIALIGSLLNASNLIFLLKLNIFNYIVLEIENYLSPILQGKRFNYILISTIDNI